MTIASRLDEAMQEAGFPSQSALARASGVPQPTINRILKSAGVRGPETATVAALAAACNVSFNWLNEGIGVKARGNDGVSTPANFPHQKVVIAEQGDPNYYFIKKVKLQLRAGVTGFQTVPDIYDGDTVSLAKNWADRKGYNPKALIAITVVGESMEPNLYAGDVVIVNTSDTEKKDGAVYAFNYDGEAVIKRLVKERGEWWLFSDNADQTRHRPKGCASVDCGIIGRVVKRETDHI
jgi:phage repressor protein C with HTH and peptisase S24 domain